MILSYNVVKEEDFSSGDEKVEKESIQTESTLLRFARASPIQNNKFTRNYPSSNEGSFSGKEENFIQKDVLNMLNSPLKSKRCSASSHTEDAFNKDDKEELKSYSSFSLSFTDQKMKELQFNETNYNKNGLNTSKSEVFPKNCDEKIINISVDGSMISDVSQGSKNFIPKISIKQEQDKSAADSPQTKGRNIEKINEDLKPNAIAYYNVLFPPAKLETDSTLEQGITFDLKIFEEKPQPRKETKMEMQDKISTHEISSSSFADEFKKKTVIENENLEKYRVEPEEEEMNRNTTPNQFIPMGNIYGQYRNVNMAQMNYNNIDENMSNINSINSRPQWISDHNSLKKVYHKNIPNYVDMSNEELVKYCHIICKDQAGCRFLQKKIDENPKLANDTIYFAIFDKILELMYDGFANYFVQKVIDCISEDKLEKVVLMITPEFSSLGLDPHGTRVIQKIIENIKSAELLQTFTGLLIPNFDEFIVDPNANHILIKYASVFSFPKSNVIFDYLNLNVVYAATQKHSCCALQKCIEVANDIQKIKLFNTIADNSIQLITNPYGNYVVQFVVSFGAFEVNARIAQLFLSDIAYLSKQKFSSNVIEKCFDYCDDKTKLLIVKEVCNPKIIPELLLDMYGNYVLQKALSFAVEPYRSIFIGSIGPYLDKLKALAFGSKLYMKLIIAYPEFKAYAMPKEGKVTQTRGNNNWNLKSKKKMEMMKQLNQNFDNLNSIPSMSTGVTPMKMNLNQIGMSNMKMPMRNMNIGIATAMNKDSLGMNTFMQRNMNMQPLNSQFQPNLNQYEYMMNMNMNLANLMQLNQNQKNEVYFSNSNYKMNPYS